MQTLELRSLDPLIYTGYLLYLALLLADLYLRRTRHWFNYLG